MSVGLNNKQRRTHKLKGDLTKLWNDESSYYVIRNINNKQEWNKILQGIQKPASAGAVTGELILTVQ